MTDVLFILGLLCSAGFIYGCVKTCISLWHEFWVGIDRMRG